jgi:hypothetical protein
VRGSGSTASTKDSQGAREEHDCFREAGEGNEVAMGDEGTEVAKLEDEDDDDNEDDDLSVTTGSGSSTASPRK